MAVASLKEAEGHKSGRDRGVPSRRGSLVGTNLEKNIFVMQNPAFWCNSFCKGASGVLHTVGSNTVIFAVSKA